MVSSYSWNGMKELVSSFHVAAHAVGVFIQELWAYMCDEYRGGKGKDFYTQILDARCQGKATAYKRYYCLLLSASSPHVQSQKSFSQRMSLFLPVRIFVFLYHLLILTQTNTREL